MQRLANSWTIHRWKLNGQTPGRKHSWYIFKSHFYYCFSLLFLFQAAFNYFASRRGGGGVGGGCEWEWEWYFEMTGAHKVVKWFKNFGAFIHWSVPKGPLLLPKQKRNYTHTYTHTTCKQGNIHTIWKAMHIDTFKCAKFEHKSYTWIRI